MLFTLLQSWISTILKNLKISQFFFLQISFTHTSKIQNRYKIEEFLWHIGHSFLFQKKEGQIKKDRYFSTFFWGIFFIWGIKKFFSNYFSIIHFFPSPPALPPKKKVVFHTHKDAAFFWRKNENCQNIFG